MATQRKLARQKEEVEEARLAMQKAEEARLAREKAEEEARVAREKAAEEARVARDKAEEEARVAREQAEEEARVAMEKSDEEAQLARGLPPNFLCSRCDSMLCDGTCSKNMWKSWPGGFKEGDKVYTVEPIHLTRDPQNPIKAGMEGIVQKIPELCEKRRVHVDFGFNGIWSVLSHQISCSKDISQIELRQREEKKAPELIEEAEKALTLQEEENNVTETDSQCIKAFINKEFDKIVRETGDYPILTAKQALEMLKQVPHPQTRELLKDKKMPDPTKKFPYNRENIIKYFFKYIFPAATKDIKETE